MSKASLVLLQLRSGRNGTDQDTECQTNRSSTMLYRQKLILILNFALVQIVQIGPNAN